MKALVAPASRDPSYSRRAPAQARPSVPCPGVRSTMLMLPILKISCPDKLMSWEVCPSMILALKNSDAALSSRQEALPERRPGPTCARLHPCCDCHMARWARRKPYLRRKPGLWYCQPGGNVMHASITPQRNSVATASKDKPPKSQRGFPSPVLFRRTTQGA